MCDDEDQIISLDTIEVESKLTELSTYKAHPSAPTQTIIQEDPATGVTHPQDQIADRPISNGSAAMNDPPGNQLRTDEEMDEEMEKCLEKHDKKYCENEIAAKFLNRLIRDGIIY